MSNGLKTINYPQSKVNRYCSVLVSIWKNIHHLSLSYCYNSPFLTPFSHNQPQTHALDLISSIIQIFLIEHFALVLRKFYFHLKCFDAFTLSKWMSFSRLKISHLQSLGYYFIYSLQHCFLEFVGILWFWNRNFSECMNKICFLFYFMVYLPNIY